MYGGPCHISDPDDGVDFYSLENLFSYLNGKEKIEKRLEIELNEIVRRGHEQKYLSIEYPKHIGPEKGAA